MALNWREDLHPRAGGKFSSKGGGSAGGTAARMADVKVSGERKPGMTDAQFKQRASLVEQVIGQHMKTHATEKIHADENGHWSDERNRLHHEIANHLYEKHGANVPNNAEAVIAGGLGGAGKSTVLGKHLGIEKGHHLTLNPDDVKEEMARRNLVPEVPGHPHLSPMERAALVHEESSRITGLMADRAYKEKKNVMWDITMSSHKSVQKRLDDLKKHGYKDPHGVFVHIPAEKSVQRAMDRYRRGVDQFHNGEGHGGRFVPPKIIMAQKTSGGSTINRETFHKLRGQFGRASVYDNSVDGRAPARLHDEHRTGSGWAHSKPPTLPKGAKPSGTGGH